VVVVVVVAGGRGRVLQRVGRSGGGEKVEGGRKVLNCGELGQEGVICAVIK
jgi:hypothetical protein